MHKNKSLIHKPNFFILTGGPGSGKTTVLNELKKQGYITIPEVARDIIKKQQQESGSATHHEDRDAFRDLMLHASINDFHDAVCINSPVFFDRGIPDLEGYTQGFCRQINHELQHAIKNCRYNNKVFIFPPWEGIYSLDEERKQDFEEAVMTYEVIKNAYQNCGYTLFEMPKTSLLKRVAFILKSIQTFGIFHPYNDSYS